MSALLDHCCRLITDAVLDSNWRLTRVIINWTNSAAARVMAPSLNLMSTVQSSAAL